MRKWCKSLILFSAVFGSVVGHAGDRPILDWFNGRFTSGEPNPPSQIRDGRTTQAGDSSYSGSVPPADGRAWVQMGTSPNGGAEALVLSAIDSAKTSIRVAAYSFTSKSVAEALVKKHRAGVSVMVVVDKSQLTEKYTAATYLANMGVPVRVNSRYAIQHNKFLCIDNDTIQTGSFNYSSGAVKANAENVLVVWHHQALARQYGDYWLRLWDESDAYKARY